MELDSMIIDKMLKEKHLQEQDVRGCQIFDFGCLTEMPFDITEEEKSAVLAFNEGFLNLPAPECIFVGSIQFKDKSLSLIFKLTQSDEQGDIEVFPFHRGWMAPFTMQKCSLGHPKKTHISLSVPDRDWAELTSSFDSDSQELAKGAYVLFYTFVTVSLGRLISDGIEQERRTPPEKLNKKRIARGHPEMVSHTVVKLKPCRLPMGRSGSQGEYFTPKRYHFRRGHVRCFSNGQKTWVRSCFVGDISQGRVDHRYEVSA
jgi:hypothetical protein